MRAFRKFGVVMFLSGLVLLLTRPAEAQITFRDAKSAGANTITFVGDARRPSSDLSTTNAASTAITPPGGMGANDYVVVFVAAKTPGVTITNSATGGQTWTAGTDSEANGISFRIFHCRFNGTWTADPSFAWTNSVPYQVWMVVFRGVDTTTAIDAGPNIAGFTAPASPFDVAIAVNTLPTVTANAMLIASWHSADENTWALQTAGWSNPNGVAQWRHAAASGAGSSSAIAYKVQAAGGGSEAVTDRQATLGGDAGIRSILALRPAANLLTITKPTGTVTNDVMIASIAVRPNTVAITAPAGWLLVRRTDNTNATANSLAVYRKVAVAGEPASYTWTIGAGHGGATGGIQTFTGVDTTTPIDVEDGNCTPQGSCTPGTTSHATRSVTTTVANTMLVMSYGVSNPGPNHWAPVSTMTESFDATGGSEAIAGYRVLQAAAGATGAKTATSAAGDVGNAHILALRPPNVCSAVPDATYVAATAPSGTTSATVYWWSANPAIVLRKAGAAFLAGEVPVNGTTYAAGGSIGAATVAYDGSAGIAGVTCTETSCTNTGLTNGTTYYYKIFPKNGTCYAAGTGAEVNLTPQAGPYPAWSYTLAGGPMLKAGIAGDGTAHTTSNAKRIVALNTADGTPTWTPTATNEVIQSWLSWIPGSSGAGWYNASWTARKRIRIDKTKVGSGGVIDFPVLISLIDTGLKNKAQASGNDILFTASDGTTKLSHEIERYTSATGELIAWVKVPSISSAVDTDLYMYYGNAAAANQENASGVWSGNGHVGVWHLKESPTGAVDEIRDSTVNAGHGRSKNMGPADRVAGKIGYGFNFISGASGSLVATGDRAVMQLSTYSWSMWVKGNAAPNCNPAGTNGQPLWNADSQFNFSWQHTGCAFYQGAAHSDGTWKAAQIQSALAGGIWYHVSATYGAGALTIYLNGVLEQTTSLSPPVTAAGDFSIGNGGDGQGPGTDWTNFAGQLDEVQVSNVVRSAAWIQTEYNNQSSPSTFYGVGAENASGVVIGGDQSGRVYSVDTATWDTIWTVDLNASGVDFVQATPAAQLRNYSNAAFQAAHPDDLIFVGTRNSGDTNCGAGSSTRNNKVFALQASDGAVRWTFNGTCTNQVDWIVGMPLVDYARNRLYVTSRAGTAGTQTSLWVIDTLTGALVTPPSPLTLGHLEASPTLRGDGSTIYVGSWDGTNGALYAVDANTLAVKWNLSLGAGVSIKGFMWEDYSASGRLYFSTGSDVRCVQDYGASGSACAGWSTPAVPGASTLLLLDKIYVGSSDGRLHQIVPTGASAGIDEKQFPAAGTLDGTQVGDVSTETGGEVFVGTAAGKLYKIPLPLP